MKKYTIIILLIALSLTSFSQIVFEEGYILQNNGEKETCLIKNVDWKNNPVEIKYKLSDKGEEKIANLNNILEFGIGKNIKYKVFTVKIDRSSDDMNHISKKRNPNFKIETVFLKVLIEGEASLYEYRDGNLKRFFFRMGSQPIEQLVYKLYLTKDERIGRNENFKHQLINALKCSDISFEDIKKLKYEKKKLLKIFVDFNRCKDSPFINFGKRKKRDLFNLFVKVGMDRSSLSIKNIFEDERSMSFDADFGFRFGAELEFILPFNKSKWGIILNPTYQKYNSTTVIKNDNVSGGELVGVVIYKSIELPIGIRYYFFLNSNSKLFVTSAAIIDFPLNSRIEFNRKDGSNINVLNIDLRKNIAFGGGYNYKRFSLEFRAQTPRTILGNYSFWKSSYKTMSVVLGFNIL